LQRLPSDRISRAQELGEIWLEEHPAAPGLRARNETALGARAQFFRVHAQERSSLSEIERPHDRGGAALLAAASLDEP